MTDLQERISVKLRQLGAGCSLLGFGYVKTAVELAYRDSTYLQNITTKLYPTVASQHGTTPTRAERAIRHFIENLYNNGVSGKDYIIGVSANIHTGKLTNANFIAAIAEALKCEERE